MGLSGKEYADLVASYILKNFGERDLTVYREVSMGKTIIGKNRHVIFWCFTAKARRCSPSNASTRTRSARLTKRFRTRFRTCKPWACRCAWRTPALASRRASCTCWLPARSPRSACRGASLEPSRETRELDIALAMAFRFWDLVVASKKPFALPEPALPAAGAETSARPAAVQRPNRSPALQRRRWSKRRSTPGRCSRVVASPTASAELGRDPELR